MFRYRAPAIECIGASEYKFRIEYVYIQYHLISFNILAKSGVSNEDECISLAKYVLESCPGLRFRGFMTIGDPKNSQLGTSNDNPDFIKLIKLKNRAIDELSALISSAPTDRPKLELSMGMSSDFEQAICMGSSMVRVGSSIFGARNYNKSNK